jgi:hypothetical protein
MRDACGEKRLGPQDGRLWLLVEAFPVSVSFDRYLCCLTRVSQDGICIDILLLNAACHVPKFFSNLSKTSQGVSISCLGQIQIRQERPSFIHGHICFKTSLQPMNDLSIHAAIVALCLDPNTVAHPLRKSHNKLFLLVAGKALARQNETPNHVDSE